MFTQVAMACNMYSPYSKQLLKHFLSRDTLHCLHKNHVHVMQHLLHSKPAIILGIESSCDDTGCGIVDSNGKILGEAINSQYLTHLNFGGVIPSFARSMHANNITKVCEDALRAANLKLKDVDAIAVTIKPGLSLSLNVGIKFAKYLTKMGKKPLIPVHHMEAHALTIRMINKIDFPYLVLLVSGGHCLLAIVEDVNKFDLLGTSLDNSPGEVFDKVARKLKLRNISEFSHLNGGCAIETAARKATDFEQFSFGSTLRKSRDCNFSFAGILSRFNHLVESEEAKNGIIGDMLIPNVYNVCAALQLDIAIHICQKTQRAMEFISKMSLFPENKRVLVISGGVACNNFLYKALNILCTELGFTLVRTPPKLCTDNGVMVAWNGIEKWIKNCDVIRDQEEIQSIKSQGTAPLGESWIENVQAADLKCEWVKIRKALLQKI